MMRENRTLVTKILLDVSNPLTVQSIDSKRRMVQEEDVRSILAIVLGGVLMTFSGVSADEAPSDECQVRCANEKSANDAACPGTDEEADTRASCLQQSQDIYVTCMDNCQQQPSPAPAPAPAPEN